MEQKWKYALLITSILAHSTIGILQKLSENAEGGFSYDHTELMMLAEALKWLFCVAYFEYEKRQPATPLPLPGGLGGAGAGAGAVGAALARSPLSWRESLAWSVPALCYAVTNNLSFVILEQLKSPVTAAIFGSMEMLLVGVFSVVVLKRRLRGVHWASLVLLVNAVMSSQLASCTGCTSLSDYHAGAAALTLLQCCVSAFAGVYIEKLMKREFSRSIFQQNAHLYFYGMLANLAAWAWSAEMPRSRADAEAAAAGFAARWNRYATVLVLVFAYLGLITAAIIKHMSNIAKVFATSSALVVTTLLCGALFGFAITVPFDLAVVNIGLSIYLYRTSPVDGAAAGGDQKAGGGEHGAAGEGGAGGSAPPAAAARGGKGGFAKLPTRDDARPRRRGGGGRQRRFRRLRTAPYRDAVVVSGEDSEVEEEEEEEDEEEAGVRALLGGAAAAATRDVDIELARVARETTGSRCRGGSGRGSASSDGDEEQQGRGGRVSGGGSAAGDEDEDVWTSAREGAPSPKKKKKKKKKKRSRRKEVTTKKKTTSTSHHHQLQEDKLMMQ